MTYRSGGEGGILTPAYSLSYHVFSNMPENRMNIDDSMISSFATLSTVPHK